MNQTDRYLVNSIYIHFDMKILTTLPGILDFANLIFQTCILQAEKSSSNLGKNPAQYFKLENYKNQAQIDRGKG